MALTLSGIESVKGNLKQRWQVLGNKVARDCGWDVVVGLVTKNVKRRKC